MQGITNLFELFHRGGWVMYTILFLSIYAVGILLYKFWQFRRLRLSDGTEFADYLIGQVAVQGLNGQQHYAMHAARLEKEAHPAARMLEAVLPMLAMAHPPAARMRDELARCGAWQMRRLETYIRGLELAGNLAPLLGLLGTVLGMVTVFSSIEIAGARVDAALLAGGIWTALLTTVFGLMVAVMAHVGSFVVERKIEEARAVMNDVAMRVLALADSDAQVAANIAPLPYKEWQQA